MLYNSATERAVRCRIEWCGEREVSRLPRKDIAVGMEKRPSAGVEPMWDSVVVDDPKCISDRCDDRGFASVPSLIASARWDMEFDYRWRMAVILAEVQLATENG